MILTTCARYAVAAMVDMAQNSACQPVSLALISDRQNISLSYLEQIFSKLKKAGLVRAVKGPGGGYILLHGASEINIGDIIKAINEPIKITRCGSRGASCLAHNSKKCKTHNLWHGLELVINDYLKSISIADVCRDGNQLKQQGFFNESC